MIHEVLYCKSAYANELVSMHKCTNPEHIIVYLVMWVLQPSKHMQFLQKHPHALSVLSQSVNGWLQYSFPVINIVWLGLAQLVRY